MKIKERYASLLEQNAQTHKVAAERLEALEASGVAQGEVLGDSDRREFLAMADHQVDAAQLDAGEVRQRVRSLYEGAQVLFASKRQAIVRVGVLIVHCNRFGVCSFVVPSGIPGPSWGSLHTTPCYSFTLPEAIGATVDYTDRQMDRIHNYSACRP